MAIKKQHLDELARTFAKVKTPAQALELLQDVLTPKELASVAERIQIVKQLLKGVPHRTISASLKVSISKVTRGSHAVKRNHGGFARFLKS